MADLLAPLNALIDRAVTTVPAVKFAVGIGGIIAIPAIFTLYYKFNLRVAFLSAIIMLILMVLLVLFAALASAATDILYWPMIVFTWFCLTVFMAVSCCLFTSTFFRWPVPDLQRILIGPPPPINKPIINPPTPMQLDQMKEENIPPLKPSTDTEYEIKGDISAIKAIQSELRINAKGKDPKLPKKYQNDPQYWNRDDKWHEADTDWEFALKNTKDENRRARLLQKLDPDLRKTCTDLQPAGHVLCKANSSDSDELNLNGIKQVVKMH